MYQKRRRVACFIMAVCLSLLFLAGCASKTETTPTTNEPATTGTVEGRQMDGNLYLEGTPIVKDKETYKIMITYTLGTKNPNDMLLYKQRAKDTNVEIVYDYVLSTAVNERKATLFASGDLPDALANILSTDEVVKYSTTGSIISLDQFIGKYTPEFDKIIAKYPDVKLQSIMPDGKIYGLPQVNHYSVWPGNGVYEKSSWVINKEWLKNLNLNEPTTTEELKNVLMQFKTGDPNKNGKADEIPYSFCYADTWAGNFGESMFGPFGLIGPGYNVNVKDGKAFFAITDPRYKEVVKYVRDLYANGLIDKEAFTQTSQQYQGKGQAATPVYGMASGWTGDIEVGPARIKTKDNPNAPYEAIAPMKGPNGDQLWGNMSAGVSVNKLVITSSCKSPKTLVRYMDELYKEKNSVQEVWGMFNQCLEDKNDGKYTRIPAPDGWNTEEWLRDTTTRVLPCYIPDELANNIFLKQKDSSQQPLGKNSETKYIYSSVYAPYAVKEYYPNVIRTAEEVDELGRLWPQLKNLMMKKEVEWMQGVADIDKEYDAFLKELEKFQINKVIELYQTPLDRYNGIK